ncbi:MAG: ribonuclease H-like domain-containing protein [Spirochaetes bacterium]|nr:ribonuclease H-like domain-containing protein [Spirochaetota bacterium]
MRFFRENLKGGSNSVDNGMDFKYYSINGIPMKEKTEEKKITLDELKRMGVLKKASEIKSRKLTPGASLKTVFPEGEFIETPFKQVFKVSKSYPLETKIGDVRISDINLFNSNLNELFSILGKNDHLKNFQFDKLLFFDVESTGLSCGAGNMAFLVGLGFFNKKKEFVIEQYFIEDYINEKGMLYILEDFFKKKFHLISYNGKCFDFYLLKSRFIMSRRFSFTLDNLYHFDLLHTSRRMWKNLLPEFNLGTVEKHILKFIRSNEDIPGYLIPEYYKDYLKTRNAGILEGIFYHNLMDVRSMLGLLIIQVQNMQNLLDKKIPEMINYNSMASLLYPVDQRIALDLLQYSCNNRKDDLPLTLRQLYHHHKSEKDISKMKEYLNKMIEDIPKFDYFPYMELSKIHEHTKRDYKEAIRILGEAEERIRRISKMHNTAYTDEMDDIIKRTDRLKSKCLKQ